MGYVIPCPDCTRSPFLSKDDVHPHSVVLTRGQTGAFRPHLWLLRCSGPSALPPSGVPRLITTPAPDPVSAVYGENCGEKWSFQPVVHSTAGPGSPPATHGGRGLRGPRVTHAAGACTLAVLRTAAAT